MADNQEQPRDFLAELDALDGAKPASKPESPMAELAEPMVGTTPTAQKLTSDGTIDWLSLQHQVYQQDELASARRESSKGIFEGWGKLDDAGKKDWVKGEKEWADWSHGIWSGFRTALTVPPEGSDGLTVKPEDDVVKAWLLRKIDGEIGIAQHRRKMADEMEAGLRAAPEYSAWRAKPEAVGRGVAQVAGSFMKGIGYASQLARSEPLTQVDETTAYKFGEMAEAWGKATFPADPARASEFSERLAEGAGSMVAFMGPGLAARLLVAAGPMTMATISGTTGAFAQSGSMADDAKKAVTAGKTVDGKPVSSDAITAAFLLGLPIGATEAFPLAHLFGGSRGQFFKAVMVQAAEEGGQEFIQQIAENVVARAYYDDKRIWDDNAWDGLAIGAMLGAKTQTAVEAYAKVAGKVQPGVKSDAPSLPATAPVSPEAPKGGASKEPETPEGSTDPKVSKFALPELQFPKPAEPASAEGFGKAGEALAAPEAAAAAAPQENAVVPPAMPAEALDYIRQTNPELAKKLGLPEEAAVAQPVPNFEERIAQALAAPEVQPEEAAKFAGDVQVEFATRNLGAPSAQEVQGIGRLMAAGLNTQEATERYAIEQFEEARKARSAQVGSQAGVEPSAEQASGVAGGARQDGRADAGMGGSRTGPGTPAAAQPSGKPVGSPQQSRLGQRLADIKPTGQAEAVQRVAAGAETRTAPAEASAPAAIDPALTKKFISIIAGKAPRSQWQGLMGVDRATMRALIDAEVASGLLRIDKHTGLVKRETADDAVAPPTPPPAPVAPVGTGLAVPGDMRIEAAIRSYEAETKRPVSEPVRNLAQEIENVRGTAGFSSVMDRVRSSNLKKADALALAAVAGLKPTAKTSKAQAIESIQTKHDAALKAASTSYKPEMERVRKEIATIEKRAVAAPAPATEAGKAVDEFSNSVDALKKRLGVKTRQREFPNSELFSIISVEQQDVPTLRQEVEAVKSGSRIALVGKHLAMFGADAGDVVKAVEGAGKVDVEKVSVPELQRYVVALEDLQQVVEDRLQYGYKLSDEVTAMRDLLSDRLTQASDRLEKIQDEADATLERLSEKSDAISERYEALMDERFGDDVAARTAYEERSGTGVAVRRADDGPAYSEDMSYLDVVDAEARTAERGLAASEAQIKALLDLDPAKLTLEQAEAAMEALGEATMRMYFMREWTGRLSLDSYNKSAEAWNAVDALHDTKLVPDLERLEQAQQDITEKIDDADIELSARELNASRGGLSEADAAALEAKKAELRELDAKQVALDRATDNTILASIESIQQDISTAQAQKRELDSLGFYSQALEAAKSLKQKKGTVEQMRAQLRSAGVKEAEIAAVGLDAFFASKMVQTDVASGAGAGSVNDPSAQVQGNDDRTVGSSGNRRSREPIISKDEIVSFLRENRVEVKEATYGEYNQLERNELALRLYGDEFHRLDGPKADEVDRQLQAERSISGMAKWSSYSIDPSNPTYRETVIHLPAKMPDFAKFKAESLANGVPEADIERNYQRLVSDPARMAREDATNFTSGHWSEPNVIAHARTSLQKTADGKTVFLVDELQSDAGQQARDGGVRDEAKIAELRKRLDDAERVRNDKAAPLNAELDALGVEPYETGGPAWKEVNIRVTRFRNDLRAAERNGDSGKIGDLIGVADDVEAIGKRFDGLEGPVELLRAELKTAEAAMPASGAFGEFIRSTDQWTTTAFRRLIRQAVEAGADYIALTPGKVQGERFGLEKQISSIKYRIEDRVEGKFGGATHGTLEAYDHAGKKVLVETVEPSKVADYVGKEVAEKLLSQDGATVSRGDQSFTTKELSGLDLRTGGEGMRATYDSIYPRTLGKMLGKMDPEAGKMADQALKSSVDGRTFAPAGLAKQIETEVANSHLAPHPQQSRQVSEQVADIVEKEGIDALDEYDAPRGFEGSWSVAVAAAKKIGTNPIPFHTFPLTSKVKEEVGGLGQALFAIRGWHASPNDIETFANGPPSGNARIGGQEYPGATSFAISELVSGPNGGWTGAIRSERGVEPRVYEVEINTDGLVLDARRTFNQQTPEVQKYLLENADRIRREWKQIDYSKITFDGVPANMNDPKQYAAVIIREQAGDRDAALKNAEYRLAQSPDWARRRLNKKVVAAIRDGHDAQPDLFNKFTLEDQYGNRSSGGPYTPLDFGAIITGDEITVLDLSRVRIVSKDGVPVDGGQPLFSIASQRSSLQREGGTLARFDLTPAAQAAMPEVKAQVLDYVRRMLPDGVRVQVEDRIFLPQSNMGNAELGGYYNLRNRTMAISLSRGPERAFATGRHETVHVLREAGLFTDAEWKLLLDRGQKIAIDEKLTADMNGATVSLIPHYREAYRKLAEGAGLEGDAILERIDELLNQERVAKMAEMYDSGTRFGATLDALFERIKAFLEAIRNAWNGMGLQTVEDVFQRMEQGEIAARATGGRREPTFDPVKAANDLFRPEPVTPASLAASSVGRVAMQEAARVQRGDLFAFAGMNAETADIQALKRAEDMESLDASRDAIWKETGWFRGVDGIWRFEIPETGMRVKIGGGQGFRYGSPIWFEAIDDAYPQMDTAISVERSDKNTGFATDGFISVKGENPGERRSIAAHEIQHAIQKDENFAAGGNWMMWTPEEIAAERERLSVAERNRDAAEKATPRTAMEEFTSIGKSSAVADMTDTEVAKSLYRRLAGEVEARAVQKRMDMTPAQRQATPPWESYDTSEDQQIVMDQAERAMRQYSDQSLDMSAEARKARAEAMGFDTSKVWYHGSKAAVDAFDLRKAGKSDPGLVGRGVYFAPDAEQAGMFALSPHYGRGGAPNVMPVYLRMRNPAVVVDGVLPDGRRLTEAHPRGITKDSATALKRDLQRAGYDSVVFQTVDGELTQAATFDPANIRSVNAAFNPAEEGSPRLLASIISPPQKETRPFEISNYQGEVETQTDEDGNLIRVYRTSDEDGKQIASVILAEREDGSFEAASYAMAKGASASVVGEMLDAIEVDLGKPLSPTGLLSARQIQAVDPRLVQDFSPVENVAGVMASPTARAMMDAIRSEQAEPPILMAIAGVKAKGAPLSSRNLAESMERKGKDADFILKNTGWFRGPDQKWRFEIDDSAAKIVNLDQKVTTPKAGLWRSITGKRAPGVPAWAGKGVQVGLNIKIPEILSHEKLFQAYPMLRNIRVSIITGQGVPESKEGGAFIHREDGGKILYSPIQIKARNKADILPYLMHEIQHYIQKKEGFQGGSASSGRKGDFDTVRLDYNAAPAQQMIFGNELFSTTTFRSQQDATGWNNKTDWRSQIAGINAAEQTALAISDLWDALDKAPSMQGLISIDPETRGFLANKFIEYRDLPRKKADKIDEAAVREHILPALQAELMSQLRVTAEDYLGSLGEAEANAVMERLNYTPEQRRSMLVKMPKDANAGQVTPDFRESAQAVLDSARKTQAIREKWLMDMVDLGDGVSVQRWRENSLSFSRDEAFDRGAEVSAELDFENGRAILYFMKHALDGYKVGAKDGYAPLTDAEMTFLADKAEAYVRSINLLPTPDIRLKTDQMDIPQERLSELEIAFWKNRDPFFMVADAMKEPPKNLMAWAWSLDEGELGRVLSPYLIKRLAMTAGGKRDRAKDLEAARSVGNFIQEALHNAGSVSEAHEDISRSRRASETGILDVDQFDLGDLGPFRALLTLAHTDAQNKYAAQQTAAGPLELPMPVDYVSAKLDPEQWRIRDREAHQEPDGVPTGVWDGDRLRNPGKFYAIAYEQDGRWLGSISGVHVPSLSGTLQVSPPLRSQNDAKVWVEQTLLKNGLAFETAGGSQPVSPSARAQKAYFDQNGGGGNAILASIISPKVTSPGETDSSSKATLEGGESVDVRGLTQIIKDIKEALDMPVTQGVYGFKVENPNGRDFAFRPGANLRGQYDKQRGIARVRIVTDIDAIAHEGGHHLEVKFGQPLEDWKNQNASDLTEKAAPDRPMPALNPTGFSGLNLDDDTQSLLARAAQNLVAHRLDMDGASQRRSAFKIGSQQAFDPDLQREAAKTWAALVRRVGQPQADALVKDIAEKGLADPAKAAELADYVMERYSRTGQPDQRPQAQTTPTALSEGFAEFFRRYLTEGDRLRIEQPALYDAFEEFLDANDPKLLQRLENLQSTTMSGGYKAYLKASAVERGIADVATWREPTYWQTVKEEFRAGNKYEVMKQWLQMGSLELAGLGAGWVLGGPFGAAAGVTLATAVNLRGIENASLEITDKTHPILKARQKLLRIAAENGVTGPDGRPLSLKPGEDPYRIARMMAGSDRIGYSYIQDGVPDYGTLQTNSGSLADAMVEALGGRSKYQWSDKALKRFGLYLEARRAVVEWQRYDAGELDRVPVRKSAAEYAQIIKDLESSNQSYRRAAQMVYDWQHALLTLEWKAGKWTDEAYANFTKTKDWYVPFQRDLSDVLRAGAPEGSRMAERFTASKAFKGSQRDIINPIEALVKRAYETAASVQMNDMVRAAADLSDAVGAGGAGILERGTVEETMAANQATFDYLASLARLHGANETDAQMFATSLEGQFANNDVRLIWERASKGPGGKLQMPLWEKGQRNIVRFNDPELAVRLYEAMNALGREQSSMLINWLRYPATALRAGVTLHPAFVFSNIVADATMNWLMQGALPVVTQIRGGFHLASSNPTTRRLMDAVGLPASNFAELYSRVGGMAGGQNMAALRATNQEHKMEELRHKGFKIVTLPAMGGLSTAALVAAAGGALAGPVGATVGLGLGMAASRAFFGEGALASFAALSEMSESVTRLGTAAMAFKRAKKLDPTMSDIDAMREAAFTARDVLDFDRSGSKMGTAIKLVPFLSSNVQGMSKYYRQSLALEGDQGNMSLQLMGTFLRATVAPWTVQKHLAKMSDGDQRAIRDGMRLWINVGIMAAAGAALFFLYKDDPEYQDIATEETKMTHWIFKGMGGIWTRIKKPFEAATVANIVQAGLETHYYQDPRFWEKVRENFKATHTPPYLIQSLKVPIELYTNTELRTGRKIEGDAIARLPVTERFNAYTSQLALDMSKALNKVGVDMSPVKIDYALNNSFAYWGREGGVSSNYVFGRNRESPKWTDVPVIGTVINRFTLDPARSSAATKEYWDIMGRGRGPFDVALAGYENAIKSGNPDTATSYLSQLKPDELAYVVANKHFTKAQAEAHPLNRAKAVLNINNEMRRELILGGLLDTEIRSQTAPMQLSPAKQTEVHDILGRLSAIEAWNSLHDTGREGWSKRQIRDPQPVLDELKASDPRVYEEMERRRRKAKVHDYAEDRARWSDLQQEINRIIADDDLLQMRWSRMQSKSKAPRKAMEEGGISPNTPRPKPIEPVGPASPDGNRESGRPISAPVVPDAFPGFTFEVNTRRPTQ